MANGTQIVQLDPSKLVIVMDKTDVLWDERASLPVDPKLVANVGYYGILEPIIVTAPDKDGIHKVVAGRQRVKALVKANECRKAGKHAPLTCPCIIREDSDKHDGIMVVENELRRDDDPMTKARKVQRFLAGHAKDADPIALAALTFGVTKQTIENYTRILSCAPEVQQAVADGTIKSTVALQWYKLPAEEQAEKVKEATDAAKAGEKITVAKANPAKGKGRGREKERSRARAGDMRRRDEVCKLLVSTIKEWNELTLEQQAKDTNGLRGYISVLGWMLHDEAEVDEDATDALKKKGSKKVVYLIPESCQ